MGEKKERLKKKWRNGGLDWREREEKDGVLVKEKGKEKNVSVIKHINLKKRDLDLDFDLDLIWGLRFENWGLDLGVLMFCSAVLFLVKQRQNKWSTQKREKGIKKEEEE